MGEEQISATRVLNSLPASLFSEAKMVTYTLYRHRLLPGHHSTVFDSTFTHVCLELGQVQVYSASSGVVSMGIPGHHEVIFKVRW